MIIPDMPFQGIQLQSFFSVLLWGVLANSAEINTGHEVLVQPHCLPKDNKLHEVLVHSHCVLKDNKHYEVLVHRHSPPKDNKLHEVTGTATLCAKGQYKHHKVLVHQHCHLHWANFALCAFVILSSQNRQSFIYFINWVSSRITKHYAWNRYIQGRQ